MAGEAVGPIGLVGGDEFRRAAEAFDKLLLGLASRTPATVAVMPTAAALDGNPYFVAGHGIKHFERLGAKPYPVHIHDAQSANDDALVNELRRADVVYFAGGRPAHLLSSLRNSAAWECLRELAGEGTIIAGSSAGAMVLGEHVAFREQELEGLALVPHIVVMPHFERGSEKRIAQIQARLRPGWTTLGIDGATGCVLHAGEWTVEGPGRVTVIGHSDVEAVTAGGRFRLPLPDPATL